MGGELRCGGPPDLAPSPEVAARDGERAGRVRETDGGDGRTGRDVLYVGRPELPGPCKPATGDDSDDEDDDDEVGHWTRMWCGPGGSREWCDPRGSRVWYGPWMRGSWCESSGSWVPDVLVRARDYALKGEHLPTH